MPKFNMQMGTATTSEERQAVMCALYGKASFDEVVKMFEKRCREYKEAERLNAQHEVSK